MVERADRSSTTLSGESGDSLLVVASPVAGAEVGAPPRLTAQDRPRGRYAGEPLPVQAFRKYAYRDKPFENHPQRAAWISALAGIDTTSNPFTIQLTAADETINVIGRLRDQLRGLFPGTAKPGNTFGGQLNIGAGVYDVNITSANAILATFRVAILKPGQSVNDAIAEDANRQVATTAYFAVPTIEKLATANFIENHYARQAPGAFDSELLAVYRQKNNTIVVFDDAAVQALANEVRANNLADSYATAGKYTTNDYYVIVDKYQDKITRYEAKFVYSVYFVPADKVWKVFHFEGIGDKHATTELVTLSQPPVMIVQPKRFVNFTEDPYTVKVTAAPGVTQVTLAIDGQPPVPMAQEAGTLNFSFQWTGMARGKHTLLAKATFASGKSREVLREATKT